MHELLIAAHKMDLFKGGVSMPRMNSFRDVVAEKFCDDIFTVLSEYVESNPDKLESRSNSVESPDEATLSDIDIKFVDITA